ncbi:MAG TPA: permease prefix domain 1-containing protein, partial [Vicinamibacterales bacterium]|nr:permease prefix domain 1-containing protein [Vicinamibacterales bacterium]
MHVLRRFFQRLAAFLRLSRAEHDLAREFRAHLQLLEDRYTAGGLTPDEARHAALRAFGGVEQVKEHQRDARSFRWLESSRIDLRLGARMLAKYPGLAVIGGAGLAVAIAIATSSFAFFYSYIYGVLPFEDGDRVVALENWDVTVNNEMRQSMYDFVRWQRELQTVTEVGAFRIVGRN